jgi:hypothetical protein
MEPGHGEVSTRDCIPSVAEAVRYWIDTIQTAIDRGLSQEETLRSVTMVEKYPWAQLPPINTMFKNSIFDMYQYLKSNKR